MVYRRICFPKFMQDYQICPDCKGSGRMKKPQTKSCFENAFCKTCGGFGCILNDGTLTDGASHSAVFAKRTFLSVCLPFLGLFFGILITALTSSDFAGRCFLSNTNTPLSLLKAYCNRYWFSCFGMILSFLVFTVGIVLSVLIFKKTKINPHTKTAVLSKKMQQKSVLLSCIFYFLPMSLFLVSQNIPSLLEQTKQDIAQIQTASLQEATVFFLSNPTKESLPHPFNTQSNRFETVLRCSATVSATGTVDVFYLPNSLFSVNPPSKNHFYRISYTSNLHLIVSIQDISN